MNNAKMTLYEFTYVDAEKLSEKKLLKQIEAFLKIESIERGWAPGYQVSQSEAVERSLTVHIYSFKVTGEYSGREETMIKKPTAAEAIATEPSKQEYVIKLNEQLRKVRELFPGPVFLNFEFSTPELIRQTYKNMTIAEIDLFFIRRYCTDHFIEFHTHHDEKALLSFAFPEFIMERSKDCANSEHSFEHRFMNGLVCWYCGAAKPAENLLKGAKMTEVILLHTFVLRDQLNLSKDAIMQEAKDCTFRRAEVMGWVDTSVRFMGLLSDGMMEYRYFSFEIWGEAK